MMTRSKHYLFKYYMMQMTIFLTIDQIYSAEFSDEHKTVMYENCAIFDDTKRYGGIICGTDGVTYSNSFYLDCINHKEGRDVGTWHRGKCRSREEICEPNVIYEPVCGNDGRTWSNLESLICHARRHSSDLKSVASGECKTVNYCSRDGFHAYGINPVCGNNGYTYQNVAQMKCMQKDNKELQVLHDGGCLVNTVHQLYRDHDKICAIAKHRYEWNPVCGSDEITYTNPFVFLCYKPELTVLFNSECKAPSHQACVLANTNTTLVNGELVNDDFSPEDEVCGNDGKTYKSKHHVQCQSVNNKYLYLKHSGPCAGPDDNPCGAIPEENERFPICGSNGVSYVSPEALWCEKRRKKDRKLAFLHDGPC